MEDDPGRGFYGFEPYDTRHELHSVVGCPSETAGVFLSFVTDDQNNTIASGTRVVEASAIGVYRHGFGGADCIDGVFLRLGLDLLDDFVRPEGPAPVAT